jgi:hypothetical protein
MQDKSTEPKITSIEWERERSVREVLAKLTSWERSRSKGSERTRPRQHNGPLMLWQKECPAAAGLSR